MNPPDENQDSFDVLGNERQEMRLGAKMAASRRCAICQQPILRVAECRTIHHAGKEFIAHGLCLVRLRRLAFDLLETPSPIPTLTRPYGLNEFLLMKRPRTDVEILSCVAYYRQAKEKSPIALTSIDVEQQLHYTGYKVADIHTAFQQAVDSLGYFKRSLEAGSEYFFLTKKGVQMVEQLPIISD